MSTSSSGFMPERLVGTVKGEVVHLGARTGTIDIKIWFVNGVPTEAAVRGKESLHIVALTS